MVMWWGYFFMNAAIKHKEVNIVPNKNVFGFKKNILVEYNTKALGFRDTPEISDRESEASSKAVWALWHLCTSQAAEKEEDKAAENLGWRARGLHVHIDGLVGVPWSLATFKWAQWILELGRQVGLQEAGSIYM